MREPRQLAFHDWDDIEADLRLLRQGYEMRGNWNLTQTALHLNDWLCFPLDGYPPQGWFMQMATKAVRSLMGRTLLHRALTRGFSAGLPTLPDTLHSISETDDTQAVERLLQSIARFRQHHGPIHPSPMYGPMDYSTAQQVQFIHFAHHLKMLVPNAH